MYRVASMLFKFYPVIGLKEITQANINRLDNIV